jgi:hypothetical protein
MCLLTEDGATLSASLALRMEPARTVSTNARNGPRDMEYSNPNSDNNDSLPLSL